MGEVRNSHPSKPRNGSKDLRLDSEAKIKRKGRKSRSGQRTEVQRGVKGLGAMGKRYETKSRLLLNIVRYSHTGMQRKHRRCYFYEGWGGERGAVRAGERIIEKHYFGTHAAARSLSRIHGDRHSPRRQIPAPWAAVSSAVAVVDMDGRYICIPSLFPCAGARASIRFDGVAWEYISGSGAESAATVHGIRCCFLHEYT